MSEKNEDGGAPERLGSESSDLPLSETIQLTLPPATTGRDGSTVDLPAMSPLGIPSAMTDAVQRIIAPGETLQYVRYARRDQTLMITGLTPHGRRLTFEQREDRDGWYVVAAGRRRRPTERELGLIVASITQEMEAALAPEGGTEVRSAYRLAASSDQPGMPIKGLQAYRDILVDESRAFIDGQIERLAVLVIEYQAFKRFAIRHGHRIGAAFVRALGERLDKLFRNESMLQVFHKTGKSFRMIASNRSVSQIQELIERIVSVESRKAIIRRVWGSEIRTHLDEINFCVGVAAVGPAERPVSDVIVFAQRLNDEAYRAAKLGQLKGHTSIQVAKSHYQTTIGVWTAASEDEVEDLVAQMDDGPALVMAELSDFLNELAPAHLEGMSVEGNVDVLIHKAIARDGFWQGTTAMRIAGARLIDRFISQEPAAEGENDYVGGFDLGDEFYGIAIEDDRLYFAWGDLNSAGATRKRVGLDRLQHAVGWKREDGGGIMGHFLRALGGGQKDDGSSLPVRVRNEAQSAFEEVAEDPLMQVNDGVDIADYLWTDEETLVSTADIVEGAEFLLLLPNREHRVRITERRSGFTVRIEIDGVEHGAAINEAFTDPQIRLRVRNAYVSASVCILAVARDELKETLSIIREDNNLPDGSSMDVLGFLRHIADILLIDEIKTPAKISLAMGASYDAHAFVGVYSLEEIRERFPGLFYESVHHSLLAEPPPAVDHNLAEMIAQTMLARSRPDA